MNANEQFKAQIEIIRVYEEDALATCQKIAGHTQGPLRETVLQIAEDEQKHVRICDEILDILS